MKRDLCLKEISLDIFMILWIRFQRWLGIKHAKMCCINQFHRYLQWITWKEVNICNSCLYAGNHKSHKVLFSIYLASKHRLNISALHTSTPLLIFYSPFRNDNSRRINDFAHAHRKTVKACIARGQFYLPTIFFISYEHKVLTVSFSDWSLSVSSETTGPNSMKLHGKLTSVTLYNNTTMHQDWATTKTTTTKWLAYCFALKKQKMSGLMNNNNKNNKKMADFLV